LAARADRRDGVLATRQDEYTALTTIRLKGRVLSERSIISPRGPWNHYRSLRPPFPVVRPGHPKLDELGLEDTAKVSYP
jgi:hypothetical protein